MRPRSPPASAYAWSEAQLISIGRYYIHINSDDEEDNQNPNVSGDARRAQEEANHDAAAQEDEDEAEEVPEKMTTWTRKDIHPAMRQKRKTVVGIIATLIWRHGIF